MTNAATPRKRYLDPTDRVSEVLFGLIMVLTFTGSLSVAESGRAEVRTMLLGALGCNLAWGIIDGIFYLMGCLAEKGRGLQSFLAIRRAGEARQAGELVAALLPATVASVLEPHELDDIGRRLKRLPEPPRLARLSADEWLGAVGVFLIVFLSTFPVVIPFIFMQDIQRSLRISNGIAIAMLFLAGYAYGRTTGRRPAATGLAVVVLGAALVSLTIVLGG